MAKHPFSAKFVIENKRQVPHEVHVEPWANDYTLMPGEELEVLAFGANSTPWFYAVEWEGASQIYCNDSNNFKVLQNGIELECGHNRQENSPYNPPLKK
jgi:hypothetical protein